MEPASLVLGVLPVLGGAIKACRLIHKKLKTFRHYSRELRRIQKQIERQWHFFTNEIHLLLRPVIDDEFIVEGMLSDARHQQWASRKLEGAMRESLGKNYEACRDVIEEFRTIIESLHGLFQCFDELTSQCKRGESLKDAVRRLRTRMQVVYDESKFEQGIADLRAANNDLQRLREQANELSKPAPIVAPPDQRRRKVLQQEYAQFCTIREASTAFHAALGIAWSNSTGTSAAEELRHRVRLLIDARVKEHVCMNVVISCFGHSSNSSFCEQSVALEVQSQWRSRSQHDRLMTPPDSNTSVSSDDGPRKRRKVRFSRQELRNSPDQVLTQCRNQIMTDLCSNGLCSVLYKTDSCLPVSSTDGSCLGYIRGVSDEGFRHHFYGNASDPDKVTALRSAARLDIESLSMSDIMSFQAEKNVSVVEQLELARDLVLTMLKFYSTPWLRGYFSLGDLSFFPVDRNLSASLKTLHVGLDFVQRPHNSPRTQAIEEGGISSARDDMPDDLKETMELARLQYGVRNLTLWSLGTVLLQIGRWSRMEAPDNVALVRKLSSQVSSLGPRYRDLTKKCLECDFGFGDDLSKPRLQQAVYDGLVGELNDMIGSLSIRDE